MRTKTILLGVILVTLLATVGTVMADTQNAVYDSHTGNIYPTGGTIAEAVAAPDDGKFIQMDVGSTIILKFPGDYAAVPDGTSAADLQVNIYDALFPASAEIFVSLDGSTWTSVGVYSDTANIDLDLVGSPVKYVKIDQDSKYIDPAYPHLGFDLDAVVALNAVHFSDTDNDGVNDLNGADYCLGTTADPTTMVLGTNRWIWTGTTWKTLLPKGTGPASLFADSKISDYTNGCSCAQILNYLHAIYPETYGNMVGQYKYGCSRSILQDWHNALYYIETVTVPAIKDTTTLSSIALQNGKNYELKAYGTACAEMNSPPTCTIFFDAEYGQNVNGATRQWLDGVEGYEGYGTDLLDLMVGGNFVDWGTYNSAHTYWLPVTGTGSKLPLQVYDIYYPNNAGNLNVDIYAKLW
jgi:hypothetical protein